MKVIVAGYLGMLGSEVYKLFRTSDNQILGIDKDKSDLTDFSSTEEIISKFAPEVVINTAAMTNVDGCESNPELAEELNHHIPKFLTKLSTKLKFKLIHISTDYVFDGNRKDFYIESDITHPINVYGWTKLRGEKAVMKNSQNLVLRIAWLFGKNRKNFVNFIIDNLKSGKELSIIKDQLGTPTYAVDLAFAIRFLLEKNASGIYHATNEGYCSWYDWAEYIRDQAGFTAKINPITAEDFKRLATRPANSMLKNQRLLDEFSYRLPHWKDATNRFLKELGF